MSNISRKQQKQSVREFLTDIAENEIIKGKSYSQRIEIEDGGLNSYIGIVVGVEDFKRNPHVVREVKVFRHTNSANKLENKWSFSLGNICHPYADEPNIPLEFTSYGKTPEEAETEAKQYYGKLKKLIRKQTSDYKIQAAESAQEEREKLLARLNELDSL